MDGSAVISGAIQVRRSVATELCQYREEQLSRRPLHGSTRIVVSPTKLGLEPVGSPTKTALVFRSISTEPFIAAENVRRPTSTNRWPGRLTLSQRISPCTSARLR